MKLDILKKGKFDYFIFNDTLGNVVKVKETVGDYNVEIKYPIGLDLKMVLHRSRFETIESVRGFVLNELNFLDSVISETVESVRDFVLMGSVTKVKE